MFILTILLAFAIAFGTAFYYRPQPRPIRIKSRRH
jgi:hypothetical protein